MFPQEIFLLPQLVFLQTSVFLCLYVSSLTKFVIFFSISTYNSKFSHALRDFFNFTQTRTNLSFKTAYFSAFSAQKVQIFAARFTRIFHLCPPPLKYILPSIFPNKIQVLAPPQLKMAIQPNCFNQRSSSFNKSYNKTCTKPLGFLCWKTLILQGAMDGLKGVSRFGLKSWDLIKSMILIPMISIVTESMSEKSCGNFLEHLFKSCGSC